jgi:PPK2 family polyphosphate:nucleotide phosphotransferase
MIRRLQAAGGKKFRLKDHETILTTDGELKELGKDDLKEKAQSFLNENLKKLSEMQNRLYADNRFSVLIILQAMDAAGKDGIIKHVMSGVNPQGCQVFSFKKPSAEELDHNFLWRYARCLPERGRVGIFNRSYYEDVLIVKVHPELLGPQQCPAGGVDKPFWDARYDDINGLERHLTRNGTTVLKFFLYMSKKEQKRRLLDRLDRPEKNWKFSAADLAERNCWDDYMKAYEDAISATSTEWAPWHVIPADQKWVARAIVADVLTTAICDLDPRYPLLPEKERAALAQARKKLESE